MKAIIIEDNEIEMENLKTLLLDFKEIELVGTANTIRQGIERVNRERPDLLFLDLQLECQNSLEHIHQLDYTPLIICCTLYDEHALQAFEVGVNDYLTKPITHEKLCRALKRLPESTEIPNTGSTTTISLKNGTTTQRVKFPQILYITADGDYTRVCTELDKEFLCSRRMREWAEQLPRSLFISLDRSTIVNRNQIQSFTKKNVPLVTFQNGTTLEIGSTALRRLKSILG